MKSNTKKFLSVLLSVLMLFTVVIPAVSAAAADDGAVELATTPIDPSTLQIPKIGEVEAEDSIPDEKLPYGLNDTVRVSIFLTEPSARDAGYAMQGVGVNAAATSYQETLRRNQASIQAKIEATTGRAIDVKWNLTLLTNAISANIRYGDIPAIEALDGVKSVEIERRYEAPVASPEADSPQMTNARDMVRSNFGNATNYNGAGQRLAIIDTGLDIDHQSVDADAFDYAIAEDRANGKTVDLLTSSQVTTIKSGTFNGKNGIYKSTKLPFIYNYVDGNTNVTHEQDTGSEHGSHVAGIAAANRYLKSGSSYIDAAQSVGVVGEAPDAQILVMKVFGVGGGAYDSDYMAAVEDAVRLGATSANLSLGSSLPGIATETTSTYMTILNNLEDSELVLAVSMGNNTSWDSQKQLYADDVNLMTGGSPGSFNNSFTVASIDDSGAAAPLVHFGDVDVKYDMAGSSGSELTSIAGTYQFVYVDGPGYTASGTDYSSANDQFNTIKSVVNGKIALCNRGTSNFSMKADSAFKAGAKGVLIVNNTAGSLSSMSVEGYSYTGPVAGVKQSVGDMIRANYAATTTGGVTYYTGSIKIDSASEATPLAYYEMSDFSSWGVPGSLTLKPEITAPGGSVKSLNGYHKNESGSGYSGGHTEYELMSGTSMAAPQITGLSAALGQYFKDEDIASKTGLSRRHFVTSTLMSTATPVMEEESGYYYSLLKQGAGLANLQAAVDAKSFIKMDDTASMTADDYKVKAELGDDPARSGEYAYTFEIHNFSDEDIEYTLRTDVFTQALSADKTLMEHTTAALAADVTYAWDNASPVDFSADVDKDGDTDEADADAILKYVSGEADGSAYDLEAAELDGVDGISSRDAYVLLSKLGTSEAGEENQIVPAHGQRTVTVTIKLTDAQKATLNAERAGGAYVEAFTFIESDNDVTYSIPVLGFYGSWTDASMFDAVRYEESVYGTNQSSYFGATNTNGWQIRYNGSSNTSWYLGNPYVQEASFPVEKLALSNDALLYQVRYNLIRATAGAALAVVDEDGRVLYSGAPGTNQAAAFFNTQAATPSWQNTSTASQSFNRTVGSLGATENKKITFGYFAFPEYYAYQANGNDQTFALTAAQFKNILSTGNYGKGAYIGYTVTVDNEAPEIGAPILNSDGTVTLHVSDNQYIANLRVMDASGSTTYVNVVPEQSAAGEEVTYTFTPEANAVTIFVGDYAGNEAAVTTSLDGSPIVVDKTIYQLTSTLTAGNDYLIVSANAAGTGYALHYTLNASQTTATTAAKAVTIKSADAISSVPYIDDVDAAFTGIWTAGTGSTSGTYTFNNNGWYLRTSQRNALTITKDASRRDWTWNAANNRLSYGTRYLRYASNTFSLNTSTASVYLYQKVNVHQEIDPTKVTSVEVNPTSLDLYRGETASLGAKVLPLTASDRTVSWSSSNPSVATVDENGVVTAIAAGNATVTATANGDNTKKATCAVTVTLVSKNLNGIIWDEEGGEFFSSFNTANIPTWTKAHTTAKAMNLNSAFMADASTLYAATLDASNNASTLYTVNRTNYNTTEFGNNFVLIFDLARASTRYTGYFVYAFASYLVFGNLAPEEDEDYGTVSGLPYGLLDAAETDVGDIYIAAVAARSIGTTSSSFYFLDESGKIWQTTMSIGSSVSFGTPTLVVDTGIATDFLYQNLYYDGTYIYWGHTGDNIAELIIINPSTGAVYHAGNFGEGVWPATGFYVNGSAAPAAVEDETDAEIPATLERLNVSRDDLLTDAVKARIAASAAKYSFNKASSDEPANEIVGGLNTVSAGKTTDASVNAATAGETDSNNRVTVSLSEAEATNNGKIIVTYDPDALTYLEDSAGTVNNGLHFSVNAADGTITVAYATLDAIAADAEILNLTFEVKSCADTKVTAVTNELNDELALDVMTEPAITGLDHDWGDWDVTTPATCVDEGEEKRTCARCGEEETRTLAVDPANHTGNTETKEEDIVPATCAAEGTYNLVTYCADCGAKLSSEAKTLAIDPANHTGNTETKEEDIVPATCAAEGSYNLVTYCADCGAKLGSEAKTLDIDPANHTGETYTKDEDIIPATCAAEGSYNLVTYCAGCDAKLGTEAKTLDVDPANHTGNTGTRNENVVNANCVTAGSYDVVTYCADCGVVLNTEHVDGATDPNTHTGNTRTEEEDIVPATCAAEGSYNLVTYCADCGAKLGSEAKTLDIDPANHTGETYTKDEDIIPATCAAEGSYYLVTYCAGCDAKLGSEPKTLAIDPANHTGETYTKDEDIIPATCAAEGSYNLVTYCAGCDAKLGTEVKTLDIDPANHTGETRTVEENVVPATCEAGGSYDSVTYCAACGVELDRITVNTDPIGHDYAITYTWSDDNATVTATAVCANDETHVITETAETSCTVTKEATSEAEGEAVYTVSFTSDLFEDQTKTVALPKLDADYEFVGFAWNDDNTAVAIVRDNNNDGKETRIPATVTSETTDAKCEEDGAIVYTASIELNGETYTDTKTEVIPATGHTPAAPVKENESAATCTDDGSYDEVVYCAVCEKELSRTKKTVSASGHKWNAPVWTWSDDFSTATATFTCANDASHTETVTAAATQSTTEPTCTENGKLVFTATVSGPDGKTYTASETQVIEKLGHDYNENGVCNRCGDGGDCPWCGQHHDRKTVCGWWTELIHHIKYIFNRILLWWSCVAK